MNVPWSDVSVREYHVQRQLAYDQSPQEGANHTSTQSLAMCRTLKPPSKRWWTPLWQACSSCKSACSDLFIMASASGELSKSVNQIVHPQKAIPRDPYGF